MARQLLHSLFALAALSSVQAYFLVGTRNILVSERLDPIINPGTVSGHVHSVVGGSNFGMTLSTASLRNSECTSMPIQEDHSNYWYPHLYFQHKNGSFSSLNVGNVIYYLYNDAENGQPNTVQAFPDDFRMISGDMTLRSYNASSYAQQAVTFLCLDFNGVSTKYNQLPPVSCPSGIRAQINFPMCWDGKNLDSSDHKSHVAFPSGGPDSGTCDDPNFPVTLPRVFIEGYWDTGDFDAIRDTDAMNSTQPYVFAHGDPTGYGYHADFYNGWKSGVLQNVLDKCACTSAGFGDASCCSDLGVFTLETSGTCSLTPIVDEQVLGTVDKLPGNNPVRAGPQAAPALAASSTPAILSPAYAYTGSSATATGTIATPAASGAGSSASATVSSASATGSGSGAGQSASGSSVSATASATSGNAAGASAASGSGSASGSASNVGASASASGSSAVVVTGASSSGTGSAGATSIPAPAYGYSSSNAASASSGSPTTNVQAVIPTATASSAASTSSGEGDDDDDDDCTDTDDNTSTSADVQAVVPTASATDTSDSTATASPASAATPTQASEVDSASTDSANVATPTQASGADSASTDSANVATPTQASEADSASTDSANVAIPTQASGAGSASTDSANVATPTQASDTETETSSSTDSSDSASASAFVPSAASPTSTSSSSTGQGNGSSSSGWGDDDDDEYEFYCVRRKKKPSYGKRALPKARRNHNAHRRLTLDDF